MKTVVIASIAGLAGSVSAATISNTTPSYDTRTATVGGDLSGITVVSTNSRGGGIVNIDLSGLTSNDGPGAFANTLVTTDIAAALGLASGTALEVDAIGWDVTIETIGLSWRSEAVITFEDADNPGALDAINLTPGLGDDSPGTTNYSSGGLLNLADNGLGNIALTQGVLLNELFESYDDGPGADANYLQGSTITVSIVPAPASAALLGLGGLAATRRRR
jgi:hypothetical protein